jgi:hypothetical protein
LSVASVNFVLDNKLKLRAAVCPPMPTVADADAGSV